MRSSIFEAARNATNPPSYLETQTHFADANLSDSWLESSLEICATATTGKKPGSLNIRARGQGLLFLDHVQVEAKSGQVQS